VILGFDESLDNCLLGREAVPAEWRDRQQITFELAEAFLRLHTAEKCRFEPIGVAQAWSPASFAESVSVLQKQGYRYIALGGLVPLRTQEILAGLSAANEVRSPDTKFHLLGVTRLDAFHRFEELGAVSFDSTSPLRQAFKDDKDNYYTLERTYTALRVPQVEGNPRLARLIRSGQVDMTQARSLESACLDLLKRYDATGTGLELTLTALLEYDRLCESGKDRTPSYRETLEAMPWKHCECEICLALGIHVVLFRGAERNRRRGFHNLHAFHRRLERKRDLSPLGIGTDVTPASLGRP